MIETLTVVADADARCDRVIAGQDIADVLMKSGINTPEKVRNWMLSIAN